MTRNRLYLAVFAVFLAAAPAARAIECEDWEHRGSGKQARVQQLIDERLASNKGQQYTSANRVSMRQCLARSEPQIVAQFDGICAEGIFIVYGLILIALLVSNRPKISRTFFFFLLCFIFFGSVAVIADTFYGEGVITIFGKIIDYEQLAESMGALSLSCAFTSAVVRELPLLFHFSDKGGLS